MSEPKPVKQGDALLPKFVYHLWLVVIAAVILLANSASRSDHHHQAGVGFEMLLFAYTAAVIGSAAYQKARRGQLYDRSEHATKVWNAAVWGGVPAVFILSCLVGFAGGAAVAIASAAYLALMASEAIVAQRQSAPARPAPVEAEESPGE